MYKKAESQAGMNAKWRRVPRASLMLNGWWNAKIRNRYEQIHIADAALAAVC